MFILAFNQHTLDKTVLWDCCDVLCRVVKKENTKMAYLRKSYLGVVVQHFADLIFYY